jgi:plasmid stabilization system protein ParE
MQHQVIITPSAKADIFETRTWLLENHPDAAENWLWNVSNGITSLANFPERCPESDEGRAFDITVRQLLFGNRSNRYRILFSIFENKVYILRVRSTRQRSLLDGPEEN